MMLFRNVAAWAMIICTLASIIQFCYSINCYQCRSDLEKRCYDLQGKEYLKPCQEKDEMEAVCRTATQLFYLTQKSDRYRECAYNRTALRPSSTWIMNDLVKRDIIVCTKDSCNTAHTLHMSLSTWPRGLVLLTAYAWLHILAPQL